MFKKTYYKDNEMLINVTLKCFLQNISTLSKIILNIAILSFFKMDKCVMQTLLKDRIKWN